MPDWLCDIHGLGKAGLCDWCSRPLCNDCIADADGKKYCAKCSTHLPMSELGNINESIARRGRQNVDPTLSIRAIEEKKKAVEVKVSTNKDTFKGVKNSYSEESADDLRKKREEFEKMRKKFNI